MEVTHDCPKKWTKEAGEIEHFARLKEYPLGGYELMVCSAPVFREPGWEARERDHAPRSRRDDTSSVDDERARRRAAAKVREIALCNEFRYFVTLTLDAARVDRYDMAAIMRKVNAWLDNNVRRHGLAYVLVPELHKDGAVHFHGFFNAALPVKDSGTLSLPGSKKPRKPRSAAQRAEWLASGGHVVYNLPGWSLGFSTAIELYGGYAAAVGYVCKYVRKQKTKIGGRWYYSGGNLGSPKISYPDVDLRELEAAGVGYTFGVAGKIFHIVRGGAVNDIEEGIEQLCDADVPRDQGKLRQAD